VIPPYIPNGGRGSDSQRRKQQQQQQQQRKKKKPRLLQLDATKGGRE